MARGYNKAMLMGNLTKDPDVRVTQNKQKCARFILAVGRQWKDRDTGDVKEHTDFISCSAWGNTADIAERYLRKGDKCFVEGRVSTRNYEDEETKKRVYVTEIIVEKLELLGGKKDSSQNSAQEQAAQTEQSGISDSEDFPLDFADCPF